MMARTVADLEKRFSLDRHFRNYHTTVQVDGVLVRIPNPEKGDREWVYVDERGAYEVPVGDLLQSPSVVRSARVSTGRETKEVDEKAIGMVKFLRRDRHVTPSEGGVIFRLVQSTPIAYAQPFFRLFAAHNEFSGRYSTIPDHYYTPATLTHSQRLIFQQTGEAAKELYKQLLEMGLAKEMARLVHPYRFYTKFYLTISLREICNFLSWENVSRHNTTEFNQIRALYHDMLRSWDPWSYEAYLEHPHVQDFSWVKKEITNLDAGCVECCKRLDHEQWSMDGNGSVTLTEVSGDENLMIRCMDDFPNPEKGFGHGSMSFFIRMPIFVFRQWVRHRYGHWTELTPSFDSARFYVPSEFRKQHGKVGHYTFSGMTTEENEVIRELMIKHCEEMKKAYVQLRDSGLSAEVASMILPYSFYVPVVWTPSLPGLFNFLSLRTDSHAQREIREYAYIIWRMFSVRFPKASRIFAKYFYYGDYSEVLKFK